MEIWQWGGIAGASIALITAVVGAIWWFAKRTIEANAARLDAELKGKVADADARAARAETEAAVVKADITRQMLEELRHRISTVGSALTSGQLLQREVENELRYVMHQLGATESSVLVRDPDPESEYLFFLAAHGPAAPQLQKILVGPDSIAGKVLRQGKPLLVEDPYQSPDFSPIVDSRTQHITRSMITVPLFAGPRVVGVAQFLNKENCGEFVKSDLYEAVSAVELVGLKVGEFVRDTGNFVQIGLYSPPSPGRAAILFCDLSSSSLLFRVLHESGAVACINDYLSQVTDTVLDAGGSIDQYLGDGAMFRFIDASFVNAEGESAAVRAAAGVAWEALAGFKQIKQSWLKSRWEVQLVHSRLAIAYGPYREVLLGPDRHRELVVLGASVHRAAQICDAAPRDRSVALVDGSAASLLYENYELAESSLDHNVGKGIEGSVFELIRKLR